MDLGVSYKGLDNQASNMSVGLNGAAAEARLKPLAIHQQIQSEMGRLGAEMRDNGKTDTGLSANHGGAAGMFGNTAKAIGSMAITAGVTAIAGPLAGGAVGFGLAIKDAVQSMGSKSPQADESNGYYSLKNSMKKFDAKADPDSFQYANHEEDPICQNYQAACDGVMYQNGFAAPVSTAHMLTVQKNDTAEERLTKERIGKLKTTLGEHENTLDTVANLAPKNGVVVAEGPKAPVGMGSPSFAP